MSVDDVGEGSVVDRPPVAAVSQSYDGVVSESGDEQHVEGYEQGRALPGFLRLALEGRSSQLKGNDDQQYRSSHGQSEIALKAQGPLVPPLNFQNVAFGLQRSGHPNERNYEFLRRLGLKTILYLATDDYRSNMSSFASEQKIEVIHLRINVNKEPFAQMEEDQVAQALAHCLDSRLHPMLVHCNKGKYRVGCVIGILRRLQGWSYTSIFEEYARFAGTKALDEEVSRYADDVLLIVSMLILAVSPFYVKSQFIEAFDLTKIPINQQHKPSWLA